MWLRSHFRFWSQETPGYPISAFVNNFRAAAAYTGLATIYGNWFYVKNGAIDWSYTGYATNENGTWYVENGMVVFN